MKKILILANNDVGLYKFRKELLENLVENHEVYISLPDGKHISALEEIGCIFINTPIDRRGTNPITDLRLILHYRRIINKLKPDVVLTYTIKPNIYGGIACSLSHTSYIANVTGLGTSIENDGFMQKISLFLYKTGLKKASCVFFQNLPNRDLFKNKSIVTENARTIPGSGVNLEQHRVEEYPPENEGIRFLFIGRVMKDKGIDELLDAATKVREKNSTIHFDLLGDTEENYTQRLKELEERKTIKYHGHQQDVHSFIKNSHATILPSYHEGTANVLLESASSARPVLASKVTGCIETFDEGISGLGFEVKNTESLINAIIKFVELPYDEKRAMGLAGRAKMEKEFDRNIVIRAYMEEIDVVMEQNK